MPHSLVSTMLGHPSLYILVQRALGAHTLREAAIRDLAPQEGHAVLDVGCGPAYYLPQLPPCDYYGFDTDSRYIAYARRRFADRGRFYDEPYTEARAAELPKFDGILLMGLLHHLDDEESRALLRLSVDSLAPGGKVVALDTVLYEGQSKLSQRLAKGDRGVHVRSPEAFKALAQEHFAQVTARIVGDTLRTPSACLLMTMSEATAQR